MGEPERIQALESEVAELKKLLKEYILFSNNDLATKLFTMERRFDEKYTRRYTCDK